MESSRFKFFQHAECEFFPCHETDDPDDFNCIFCFCPLYALGSGCGGNFKYTDDGIKDCSDCMVPHSRGGYEHVTEMFEKIKEMAGERR